MLVLAFPPSIEFPCRRFLFSTLAMAVAQEPTQNPEAA
jgi:hypothetical protein